MNRATFAYSFQGSDHIKKESNHKFAGKKFPCQDRSFSGEFETSENLEKKNIQLFVRNEDVVNTSISVPVELKPHNASFTLVCVADGHGGARYFWSDKGAEFAIQTAVEMLSSTIDRVVTLLEVKEYEQINKKLPKSFLKRWRRKCFEKLCSVEQDDLRDKIKELENEEPDVVQKYLDELPEFQKLADSYNDIITRSPVILEAEDDEIHSLVQTFAKLTLQKIFGCTAVVYFQIKNSPVWYAFKIGDSDLYVSFGEGFIKPIKDDPRCENSKTTSLCDTNAEEFFCFPESQFLDKEPLSAFASTDGIADSFSSEEYLAKFYNQTQFSFDEDGRDTTEGELRDYIPKLSERGSGDDVSIAGVVVFDNSTEAKKQRRETAKTLAKQYYQHKEWDKISIVFKPYIDNSEPEFIVLKTEYDCWHVQDSFSHGLSIQALKLWKQVFDEINKLNGDSYFSLYQKKLDEFFGRLHDLLISLITKDAQANIYSTGNDTICSLFDAVICPDDEVLIFYKVIYEYLLVKYRYEKKMFAGLEGRMHDVMDELRQAVKLAESQKNWVMVRVKDDLKKYIHDLLQRWTSMWE